LPLSTGYIVAQTIDTLFYASILFLVASGLSLIYGIMRILNLAHGAFYMLGAYISYTVAMLWLGPSAVSFVAGFALAALVLAALGAAIERGVIRPFYSKPSELQLLITFALMIIFDDVVKMIWGPEYKSFTSLPWGHIRVGSYTVPVYTLVVIVAGFATAVALWWFFSKTTMGKQMRAAAYNSEIAAALGMNTDLLFVSAFALGAALSGFAGAMASPILTAYPGMGTEAIILSFAVIVIGGMGSILGSLVGSLIVAVSRTIMIMVYPLLEIALIYIVMVIVLLVKPVGLFGKEFVERK